MRNSNGAFRLMNIESVIGEVEYYYVLKYCMLLQMNRLNNFRKIKEKIKIKRIKNKPVSNL